MLYLPASNSPSQDSKTSFQASLPERGFSKKVYLKKIMLVFGVSLITFLLLEGVARYIAILAKPELGRSKSFNYKYQLAQQPLQKQTGVFLMGDSVMDFAIYSEFVEARLTEQGISVDMRNLAVPSADPQLNLFLLKTAIQHHVKPLLIVYNFFPRNFNHSFIQKLDHQDFENSYVWRCFGREKRTLVEEARCTIERHFYLVRYRNFYKTQLQSLKTVFGNTEKKLAITPADFPEWEVSPQGWSPGYSAFSSQDFSQKFDKVKRLSQSTASELGHYQWSDAAFLPFLQYCKREKIPVLLVWLPEHPISESYYQQVGLSHQALLNMARHYAEREKIDFIDFESLSHRPYQFVNLDHVNPVGSIAVSDAFADILLKSYRSRLKSGTS